jgi:hypothetical protein
MPAGRPTSYKPEYCDRIVEMGAYGASKAEMCADIGISRQTYDDWKAAHPEFLEADKKAVELSQGWWEQQGRVATFGGTDGFNATSYIFNMKNRFPGDWRDKKEVDVSLSHEQALDELDG